MIDDSVLVLGSRDGTRSLGAKGVESGVKGRQIRRPFHSDCDLLRMHNPGKKAAETRSSQAPTSDRSPLLFGGTCRALWVIYSSHPTPSPTLLMHSLAQAAVDIHHAALSLLPRPLRLRPSDQPS
jgi:hypothetical protein